MNTIRRIAVAAGLALAVAAAPPAAAQLWNPFNRQPAQPQPLPPPPAAVPGAGLTPPGAVPGAAAAPATNPGDLAVRLDRAEALMRTLTGQVEELSHRLRLAEEEIRRLGGSVPELSADQVAAIAPAAPAAVPTTPPAAVPAPVPGEPPQVLGAIAAAPGGGPQAGGPMDLSAAIRGALGPGGGDMVAAVATGDPRRDYETAYDLVVSGQYDLAEIGFRAFLTNYPQDLLAADAQFWVGETLFTRGRYREAADEFLTGYNAYPNSPKTPETLLKLGQSLAALGEKQTACETYAAALRQFPNAPNALRQQLQAEQGRGGC